MRKVSDFGTRQAGADIVFESVSKVFRHRPAFFNWIGAEQDGEARALHKVSLRLPTGSVLALLGPNGSGKTTLLKLISTMLLPDDGRVLVAGSDTRIDAQRVQRQVGFAVAGERSFFPRLTARENLEFFAALEDIARNERKARIEFMLARVGLLEAADMLVMKFSSGMCQRLGIARALLKQPSVILLDEPTRSLDPVSTEKFWDMIRELPGEKATVVIATHSFQEAAAVADSVAILQRGELAAYINVRGRSAQDLRFLYAQTTGTPTHEFALERCS
jgi:ABC-2 type transport system ATP-binding protein